MLCIHVGVDMVEFDVTDKVIENAAYCLKLPGRILDLSTLLAAKKFRGRGNKDGALKAMRIRSGKIEP